MFKTVYWNIQKKKKTVNWNLCTQANFNLRDIIQLTKSTNLENHKLTTKMVSKMKLRT